VRSIVLLAVAGCAFGAGGPFATLAPSVEARWTFPEDRDAQEGWQRLASDYQILVTRAEVELGAAELLEAGGAGAFDPARPPPGYTLCHGGHCHAADGRLVPYSEIEAELAASAEARAVVRLQAPGTLDLLAPARRPLDCQPDCDLPRAAIRAVRLPVVRFLLEGRVRDPRGRLVGEVPFRAEAGGLELVGTFDLPADRAHAPDVTLALRLELGAALLDSFDFAADGDLAALVRETLGATPVAADVTR
jgi:hypothetical protein